MIRNQYVIEKSFIIKDSTILVLDKKREVADFGTQFFIACGEKIPYFTTYNDYLIIVKGHKNFDGKSISFCN